MRNTKLFLGKCVCVRNISNCKRVNVTKVNFLYPAHLKLKHKQKSHPELRWL